MRQCGPPVKGSPRENRFGEWPADRVPAKIRPVRTRILDSIALGLLLVQGPLGCGWLPGITFNAPFMHTVFGTMGGEAPADEVFGSRIVAAEGFGIGLFAGDLPGVRFLRPLEGGALLATTPREGTVWRLDPDRDGDGRSDGRTPLLEGLNRPHGLDVHEGWLYVAEGDSVGRVPIDVDSGELRGEYARIVEGLPKGGNHWTRTVRIGPDGWMYVSVGSSCNVCFEEDERRAALLRFRPDGSEPSIHATGLRNSVGFDWQPGTGHLFATDNGRDLLGDDFPPCELNRIERGAFYGWPVANGDRILDPDLGEGHENRARNSTPPAHSFRAHTAPLGMVFLRHERLPDDWQGVALVALHGSWNRSVKDGYEVVSLHWNADGSITEREFVTGFEVDEEVLGRPVDVAEGADGTIYISDDYAGSIYRVKAGAQHGEATTAQKMEPTSPDVSPTGDTNRGAALWQEHDCARCHDPERGAAGVVPIPLEGLGTRFDRARLAAFLAAPTPPMPLYPLDDQDRNDLAALLIDRFE